MAIREAVINLRVKNVTDISKVPLLPPKLVEDRLRKFYYKGKGIVKNRKQKEMPCHAKIF